MYLVCAALLQVQGQPLAGGLPDGTATVALERAADGDTPVLSFESSRGRLRLLLDTGASNHLLTPGAASRLGLKVAPLPAGSFELAGGGSGCQQLRPRRTLLPPMRLGGGKGPWGVRGAEALVLPVAGLPAGIDGVLGAPLWRHLPIWIDPLGQRLGLGAVALALADQAKSAAAPAQATVLPLRWAKGVPLVPLTTPMGLRSALADTGAEGLFLSPTLAKLLRTSKAAEPIKLVGFCGEQTVERRRFAGLGLGPVSSPTVEGIVTTNSIFAALGIEAIVGQELLRNRRQLWRLDQQPPQLSLW